MGSAFRPCSYYHRRDIVFISLSSLDNYYFCQNSKAPILSFWHKKSTKKSNKPLVTFIISLGRSCCKNRNFILTLHSIFLLLPDYPKKCLHSISGFQSLHFSLREIILQVANFWCKSCTFLAVPTR